MNKYEQQYYIFNLLLKNHYLKKYINKKEVLEGSDPDYNSCYFIMIFSVTKTIYT